MHHSRIFERMREDHRLVLGKLDDLETAAGARPRSADIPWPGGDVQAVLAMLARQFGTHMAAEDEILYPGLLQALPGSRPIIEPLRAEHGELRAMLSRVEETLRDTPSAARNERIVVQLRDLVDLLRIHIRREELVVFAVAERALPAREIEALAARMERGASESASEPLPYKTRSTPGALAPSKGVKR